jgi:S1-C subfamily serine protease
VNGLDLLVLAMAVAAAVGGYRLGFITRVLSWIGLGIGLFLTVRLILPAVLDRLRGGGALWLLAFTLGLIFLGAMLGQGVGFAIGRRLRPLDGDGTITQADGAAGAVAGIIGVMALVWLTLPLLAETPGWVAEQAHGSAVAQALDQYLPDAPDSMQALRSLMGEDNFPTVFDVLRPTPELGPPPAASGLSDETAARVSRSVVKVEGIACNRIQDGTGFVVDTDLVVTNAHVVAGETETEVARDDGSRVKATVVAFDPHRDLAVLRASGLNRAALPVVDSRSDATGGVFGHPGGGPLRISPFDVARQIKAVGRDIYGTGVTSRDVLELRSSLRPGDSGSALVDATGQVVGVAFAVAPDRTGVAYALATSELFPVLQGNLAAGASTGPCTGEA